MLLLTARVRGPGTSPPFYGVGDDARVVTVNLKDGRYVDVKVEEVAIACEIEEVKRG